MYHIADVDKVLIINGGKKPKYITSGGAFIIPIIRKADTFNLCMLTVEVPADEIMISTAVPILVDWTAQIRPNRSDMDKLEICIISFKERGNKGIIDDVKLTLMGAVRDVVASMTPEQVLADKEKFKSLIQESVTDELDNMGLELVSLNIQDITDSNGYFRSIAYLDQAEKEKAEEIKRADTDRITREKIAESALAAEKAEAESEKQADIARMEAEQERNDKCKETELKIAANQVETDTAQADAEFVNIGGSNIPGIGGTETGNVLLDTLYGIPALMKILNTENQALNDQTIKKEIADLSNAALAGLGNLKGNTAEKETDAITAETK